MARSSGSRSKLVPILRRLARERPDLVDPAAAIAARAVLVGGRPVDNPRALVPAHAPIALRVERELRGTVKLRAALAAFAPPVAGRVALDLGASAGGFTVALLEAGAARVYAVDAGHGQLLGRLRLDARVVNLERTNLGALDRRLVPDAVGLVTMDLSYLPVAGAVPQLARLALAVAADLLALVKPMFELERAAPPAPGDAAAHREAVARAARALEAEGWSVRGVIDSPVPGAGGAREHLVHARRERA